MAVLLFANNASSKLAAGISNVATTLTVSAGTGSSFPNPGAGQYFVASLFDAATGLVSEIIQVTARSGDTFTIVRAVESIGGGAPVAQNWSTNDIIGNFWTAGQAATMVQIAQLQVQASNYVADTGSVNAPVATLTPVPVSLASLVGAPIRIKIGVGNDNTSATVNLNVNGLGATPVIIPGGSAAQGIPIGTLQAGAVAEFIFDGTNFQYRGPIPPTKTVWKTGSGTYTTPLGCKQLFVRMIGAGGAGSDNSGNAGQPGGDTTFGTALLIAKGGSGGGAEAGNVNGGQGGPGGTGGTGGDFRISGSAGASGTAANVTQSVGLAGGSGGSGPFGGAGYGGAATTSSGAAGGAAAANSGAGGGGASNAASNSTRASGAGGGSGEYLEATLPNPLATYAYAVGVGGIGASGNGGSGIIIIEERY